MPEERTRVLRWAVLSFVCFFLFLAVALFLPGGIGWWKGWLFLAVFLLQTVIAALYLWRKNPDVFLARSKLHKGTKHWDKVLFWLLESLILTVFPVAAFDGRYHWSSAPVWVAVLGYVLMTIGMTGSFWVVSVNKFAEVGVRIQMERGHKVVDTGPYAVVRHPMYAAALLVSPGMALALGSLWALIPAAVASILLIVRTALEDRTLQNELEGYKEYASRVRHKLVPGVW